MSYFDLEDKKNKPIIDYLENKTWLIVDVSAGTRTSIKKSIMQLGVKNASMFDADNFADAANFIETKKPNFIVGHKVINGGSSVSLFNIHLKTQPNRLKGGFFIITDPASTAEVALELEYEMDGIIVLPFTGAAIMECVLNSIKDKATPSAYQIKVGEGKAGFFMGNTDRAMETLQSAITLNNCPYEGLFYLGEIYSENQLQDKALSHYEESVRFNSEYFKSLNRLHQVYYSKKDYKKAYDINFLMAQKFPTPPSRIPELIRLSIINKKYEDIHNYYHLYQTLKGPDLQTQTYLSAGLAILGKYFISTHDTDKGVDALKGAFKFSNGKYEILKNISQSFEECNRMQVLQELFEEVDLDSWPASAQGIYFHTVHLSSKDDFMVIAIGEQLLKKKIKDPLIYKGLIERSIKLKRKSGSIEALLIEASRDFPDLKGEFEMIASRG